ncbi:MAG TPA: heparan-alpha-glucosaminide N-acetyltransferase domain-containing protein [Beijerinckiaceae bacterium]|nr:heparan-alpha-glucosaminide N-acetyltransferase domain-containing protein [Beijerinckiaceae bacterium]
MSTDLAGIESTAAASALPRPRRIEAIDALRGVALAAMFTYHFTWDLGYFGFIASDFPEEPGFKAYGHAIASLFLALVGVSLVLAEKHASWRPYLLRLAKIVAAAALVTLGTYYFAPDQLIFFGILHCIAAVSIAALPFLRAPVPVTLAAALAALALPIFIASTALDGPWIWLGLGAQVPSTLDWRPFLPWFGVVLLGLAVARGFPPDRWPQHFVMWTSRHWPTKSLAWGGRHSLFVYLVHQPIFLAVLYLVAQMAGVKPEAAEAPFLRNCENQCTATGATTTYCGNVCRCIVVRAQGSDLWSKMLAQSPDPADQDRFRSVTRECARDERPPEPP